MQPHARFMDKNGSISKDRNEKGGSREKSDIRIRKAWEAFLGIEKMEYTTCGTERLQKAEAKF